MKKIIINGANGYVASHFINELLDKNYEVIALARASKKYSAKDRMHDVLKDVNDGRYIKSENLKVYSYSLLDKDFSLSEENLKMIFKGNVNYFHFAASLKYDAKSKDDIFGTNINGLENSIDVFSKYSNSNSRFFFISTAYSCGKFSGIFKEKFYDNEDITKFRNYYEQSKRFAENIIKDNIERNNLNAHILRLSQVVGNNKSGITKTDYGVFDFTKRIYNLANRYPNKSVRVLVEPESTQNLIPIDTVVDYLMRSVEVQQLPQIMNFIAKNSIKNIHIINAICRLLPIKIIPSSYLNRKNMDALERIIHVGMSFSGSYVNTNIEFDTQNLDSIIMSINNEANEHTVYKMLEYFIDSLSGKSRSKVLLPTG
ncbi:MAG: SDR family oxidoreductase [Bacteroidales bacterium]|jgi:nucleoside-diphosphate-sugar epimerase|nr:SDR family oxidoreductase [Bacteroidales bacterium]